MQNYEDYPLAWYKAWKITQLGRTLLKIDIRCPGALILPTDLLKTVPYLQQIESSRSSYPLQPDLAKFMVEKGLIYEDIFTKWEWEENKELCKQSGLFEDGYEEDDEEDDGQPRFTLEQWARRMRREGGDKV